MSNFKEIDIANWKRREHYEFFSSYENPLFNISGQVDVTELYEFAKSRHYSFFLCYYHCAIKAINEIPEFRTRKVEGKVLQYDTIQLGTTLLQDNETISFCTVPYDSDFITFYRHAVELIGKVKARPGLYPADGSKDIAFFSVIPWIAFTGVVHAQKYKGGDSIPRLAFGKFNWQGDRLMLPFGIEADHSLVDGLHAGKLFMQMEANGRLLASGHR
jgi:chloramphenicol O-acetyltransferase type A